MSDKNNHSKLDLTSNENLAPNRVSPSKLLLSIAKELKKSLQSLRLFVENHCVKGELDLGVLMNHFDEFEHRVLKIYEKVDQYFTEANKQLPKEITCSAKCNSCCCHYPSSVEPFEFLFLYSKLRNRKDFFEVLEASQKRTDLFAKLTAGKDPYSSETEDFGLKEYYKLNKPCAFLIDGKCTTYQSRPISCRMYFSTSDPRLCSAEYLETKENESFIHYFVDEVELEIEKISQLFAKMELSDHLFLGVVEMNLFEGEFYQKFNSKE